MADPQVVVEPRKTPRQARSRALVEAILDATARVLVEEGFARTTTNRVAERAGVSVGSLYQYFPSREALVAAVARRHSARLKAELEVALTQHTAGLETSISALLDAVLRLHRISPELTAVLSGEVPRLGDLDWKAESTKRGINLTRRLIDRHVGEVGTNLDKDVAALVCSTCVEGVMNAAAKHAPHRIVDGTVVRELKAVLLRYLHGDEPTRTDNQCLG